MSLLRRPTARAKPLESDENGDDVHSEDPIKISRNPLITIPDPSQNHPSSDAAPPTLLEKAVVFTTPNRSVLSTPTVGSSRVSVRNGVRTGKGVRRMMAGEFKVSSFELEHDPQFWIEQNVQVLIRIRPVESTESGLQEYSRCVRQESAKSLVWRGYPETRFTFDNVACETTSQEQLFKAVGFPMVENCLSGYNSCMFAYGQTGSGKTYTMMGEIQGVDGRRSEVRGMTPRIFEYLFRRIHEEESKTNYDKLIYNCKCSFLEIYNEQITDLIDPSSTNLQLREDVDKGVYVENLNEYQVKCIEDVIQLLLQGSANRKVAATNMNSESSRSHSLFTCTIESRWEQDGVKYFRFSRLNLVDLAGSERQKSSRVDGERLKEAANINRSLSTLSFVIMSLVDVANGKHRHIPYRDSKLTFLLQDSLGGNSKTIIIANINPSICSANETLSTLKFAQRAKLIQNNAKVNEDASGDEMALQRQIQSLKDQVNFLTKHQNIPKSLGPSTNNFEIANVHYHQSVNKKMEAKNSNSTLIGALRREKIAEDAVKKAEIEVEHMNHLLREREDDSQRSKMIIRFREDKIKRLESLGDGLLSAEDYLKEENKALSEEIQLLRTKIVRNPELTCFALENVKLINQLRKFQEFYQKGEREMLLSEISELRNQLMNNFARNECQCDFSTSERNQDTDGLEEGQICSLHGETPEIELETIKELDCCKKELDSCLETNLRLTRENKDLQRELQNYLNSEEKLIADSSSIEIKGNEDGGIYLEEVSNVSKNCGTNSPSISNLFSKLENIHKEIEEARNLNTQLQYCESSHLSLQHETEKNQSQVDKKEIKLIINLQEELLKLQQEVQSKDVCCASAPTNSVFSGAEKQDLCEKLYCATQENNKLLQLVSDKDTEIHAMTGEWEKSIVYLTSFLVDGCQSLQDASEQMENVLDLFPQHNPLVNEHIEIALKSFLDKEILIHNLQMKLEDAQHVGLEMKINMESLKGATIAMAGVENIYDDTMKELLDEKIFMIKELENLLQSKDDKIAELEKQTSSAFIMVQRLHELCCAKSLSKRNRELMVNDSSTMDVSRYQSDIQPTGNLYVHLSSQLDNQDVQPTDSLFLKFEEAQATMKEADIIMNALLEQNENTKREKDMWKHASEELLAQVQELKATNHAANERYKISSQQLKQSLAETIDLLFSFEEILHHVKNKTMQELKFAFSDIFSFGKQLFQFIESSRSSTEALSFKMLEKDFSSFTAFHCYMGAFSNGKINCDLKYTEDKLHTSGLLDGNKHFLHPKDRLLAMMEENLEKDHAYSDKIPEKENHSLDEECRTSNLSGNEIVFSNSLQQKIVETDSFLLRRVLCQKDKLPQDLFFDSRLSQEFISTTKDIKDENEQLCRVVNQLRSDLAAKSAEVVEILNHQKELESRLNDSEIAFINSRSDLQKTKESLTIFLNENKELKVLLEDFSTNYKDAEQKLQYKDRVIDGLEREILCINSSVEDKILSSVEEVEDELKKVEAERDHLHMEIAYLNDKLEMTSALADENEAIAVEANQGFEASKVYLEQKEQEVKVLECSIVELDETIDVLERKVRSMMEEVECHQMVREDLEQEVKELKHRIVELETATEPRIDEDIATELNEARNYIDSLEHEKVKKIEELDRYRKHIAELVMHSESQSTLYQRKFKMLEEMVHEAQSAPPLNTATHASLTINKTDRGSVRTRRSSSPFKCISNIMQQVNVEKDQEMSIAKVHIEELETLASNKQKEVCKLSARLEEVDHMTHDVIRDLLEVKLDMTNYANLIDQNQLLNLLENAQCHNEALNEKEQDISKLNKYIDDLIDERESSFEEINQMKAEVLSTRATCEQIQRQYQLLTAQNEMFKIDKENLTQRIVELDQVIKKLVGSQSIQELIQQRNMIVENSLPRHDNVGFSRRLAKADQLLTLTKNDRVMLGSKRHRGKESLY